MQLPFAGTPMNSFQYASFESQAPLVAPMSFTYNMPNMAPSPMAAMPQPHLKLPTDRVDMGMAQSRPIYSTNVPFASQARYTPGAGPLATPMGMQLQQAHMQSAVVGLSPGPPLQHQPPHHHQQQPQHRRRMPFEEANRFTGIPLEDLTGAIYAISRDQHGCRYL